MGAPTYIILSIDLQIPIHLYSRRYPLRFQLITHRMAIHMPHIIQAKKLLRRLSSNGRSTSTSTDIPKGYFAVYVGEQEMKRFVVPVSLLRQPSFLELLRQSEEEFGYNHPMGGLTIPCSEDVFTELASRLVAL